MIAQLTGPAAEAANEEALARTNNLFEEFPKVALATLLKAIYYFTQDDPQHRMARVLEINASLTSKICRRLKDICSLHLQIRPFIPLRGPGNVVKCKGSKINHKPKVKVVISK